MGAVLRVRKFEELAPFLFFRGASIGDHMKRRAYPFRLVAIANLEHAPIIQGETRRDPRLAALLCGLSTPNISRKIRRSCRRWCSI